MTWTDLNRLSLEEHRLVTAAVAEAERTTDAEIVTIVAERSDHYGDVPLFWAGGVALLALSTLAAFPSLCHGLITLVAGGWVIEHTDRNLLLTAFLVALADFVLVWLVLQWRPLRTRLTPRDMKIRRTRKRAVDLFRVSAEGRTRERTGILIYLSLDEHRAEIVADATILSKIAPEAWGDIMAAMIEEVRAGRTGHGIAAAVRQAGALLALHIPKTGEDLNELPDRLIEL